MHTVWQIFGFRAPRSTFGLATRYCKVASLSSLKIVISDILSSFCTVVTVFIDVADFKAACRLEPRQWVFVQHNTTHVLHVGPAIKICAALYNLDPKIAVQLVILIAVPDHVRRHSGVTHVSPS